jgi:hypothetical protein
MLSIKLLALNFSRVRKASSRTDITYLLIIGAHAMVAVVVMVVAVSAVIVVAVILDLLLAVAEEAGEPAPVTPVSASVPAPVIPSVPASIPAPITAVVVAHVMVAALNLDNISWLRDLDVDVRGGHGRSGQSGKDD